MPSESSRRPDRWSITGNGFERLFGDSEAAFYPASKIGLGDMFLHLAFRAPAAAMTPDRITIAWAIIRRRHPLLMCKVVYDNIISVPYFSFTPSTDANAALKEAESALYFNNKSKDELIFEYMNGSRALSDDHLSHLIISTSHLTSTTVTGTDADADTQGSSVSDYDLLMCAPHFLGDGTSLHQATHDLFALLASSLTNTQLIEELNHDINWLSVLPPAFETRIVVPEGRFAKAVAKVDFVRALGKEIGGHTLPRKQLGPQRTVMHEIAFSEEETAGILKKCKSNNVTVNHAVVALCNLVWARSIGNTSLKELPLMMYTAVNLRPHLSTLHPTNTYWFVALTYFNIVLPAFLPETQEVMWHRARTVKTQIRNVIQSPFLKSRALEMGRIRVARARGQNVQMPSLDAGEDTRKESALTMPPAPSAALLGLSLIGNLDATYDRASYPSFHLYSVTTASRQKAGGLLLLEHTFGKKLWLHLCWDENGFEEGRIEGFWKGLEGAVHEFLT